MAVCFCRKFQEDGQRMPKDYTGRESITDSIRDASQVDLMDKRKRDHEYAEIALTKKLVYPKPYLPGLDGKVCIIVVVLMFFIFIMKTYFDFLYFLFLPGCKPHGQAQSFRNCVGLFRAL